MGSTCTTGCAAGGGCCNTSGGEAGVDGASSLSEAVQPGQGQSRYKFEEVIRSAPSQWQDPTEAKYMTPLPPTQEEFIVLLQKTNLSQPIGLDVDVSDEQALVIERVHDNGALPTWNKKNPAYVVRAGDAIVEVNGISADAERMTLRCTRDEILELRIQRGGGPWRRPPIRDRTPGCMSNMCTIGCITGEGDIVT